MAGGYALVVTASRTLPRHLRREKVKKTVHSQVGVCVYVHTHMHIWIICVSLMYLIRAYLFIIGDLRALRTVFLFLELQYGGSSLSICLSPSKSE